MNKLLVPDGERINRREDIPEGKTLWKIIDSTGDTQHLWDPSKESDVKAMKTLFGKMIKDGYTAFYINDKNEPGNQMKTFDERAGLVIFVPRIAGG